MSLTQSFKSSTRWLAFCCLGILWCGDSQGQQLAGIQSITGRPFVISVTPVIGPNGGVGGVAVDADGVVSRVTEEETSELRSTWLEARVPIAKEIAIDSEMRMISLSRLDQALGDLIKRGESPSQEMFFLAGLQRVQYVFVFPDQKDVVLAGPAGPWRTNALGEVVSVRTGTPVVRLDDLMDALRSTQAVRESSISCSIEPTEAGLKRYARLKSRRLSFSKQAVHAMEQALGTQQIILSGIDTGSHFARVMVVADYMMKRLAMGFEPAPVGEMPSYMEMLQRNPTRTKVTSPRWWMTTNYEPLLKTPDDLAWQIRGPGVKTLTEDSVLNSRGERSKPSESNPMAQRWADTMTEQYTALSAAVPIFGELRNCMDLAVVAALIANEDLLNLTPCPLSALLDDSRLRGPRFDVPTSVPSRASLVRGRQGWIVSVSGGVDLDAWSVVQDVESSEELAPTYQRANDSRRDLWWW